MDSQILTPILTGGFTLAAGIIGAILAGIFARRGERSRHQAEVDRQWVRDRRAVYAKYLALAEVMHREVDTIAGFLSYDGKKEIAPEDDDLISEGLANYFAAWEDKLQPLLGEVQLVASKDVADVADRVSGALMELTSFIEGREAFTSYYPVWFQAQDLIHVLRNTMRIELGLVSHGDVERGDDWPWLESRPASESYIQDHSGPERPEDTPPSGVREGGV
ncbi:hypothetical protein V1638_05240 [Pseudarthrobacter sp. J64]|uniref:hypothetical protein n=1 Tax=Pseudarthrobacter sp. J64 TaxID=3116485 RepID=UPI002E824759|nr:hypothetical protein [Pseudarthrobacter sp. J64]MEE2568799.1 hypothetical protein [Pseudarthrobacter sp. J64]